MQTASCSCPSFFKVHICKHLVGFSANMKLVKIPIEVKQVFIGQKPRRGRPCKAKKALEKQETPQETVIPTKKNKK